MKIIFIRHGKTAGNLEKRYKIYYNLTDIEQCRRKEEYIAMHTGKLEQYKRLIRFDDGCGLRGLFYGFFLYFRRNEDRIFKKQQFNVVADACFVGIKCADLFGDSSFVGEIHSC